MRHARFCREARGETLKRQYNSIHQSTSVHSLVAQEHTMVEISVVEQDERIDSQRYSNSKRLVLVCCHGTYNQAHMKSSPSDAHDEANWILQPFQKSDPKTGKEGEHHTFIKHIEAANSLLDQDPDALLVFSGGKTQTLINVTESESYLQCSADLDPVKRHLDRTMLETQATDSYQNLLFSILAFHRRTGSYPGHVTVVTHDFKERRFLELHARAIKWPLSRINVLGVDPPFTPADREETLAGEQMRGYGLFAENLYGVRDPLAKKRRDRGWNDAIVVELCKDLEPEAQALLVWAGGDDGKRVFPVSYTHLTLPTKRIV